MLYHSGKANVVADALSQKSMGSLAHLEACQRPLAREVYQLASLGVLLTDFNEGGVIVQNRAESSLVAEVKEKQFNDPLLAQLKERIHKNKTTAFCVILSIMEFSTAPTRPQNFNPIYCNMKGLPALDFRYFLFFLSRLGVCSIAPLVCFVACRKTFFARSPAPPEDYSRP